MIDSKSVPLTACAELFAELLELISVVFALHPEPLSSGTVESCGLKSSAEPWGISRLLMDLLLLVDISLLVRGFWKN